MASRKIFHAKPSYIFPTPSIRDNPVGSDTLYEFEESDIWSSNSNSNTVSALDQPKKSIPMRDPKKLGNRKMSVQAERTTSSKATSASLPVNIPDWSKILKDDYKGQRRRESDDDFEDEDDYDDDDDEESQRMPPHEYLARKRGASLSVHEGIGRTLKGRDLRRVRNAIWKKTGFED